MLPIFTKVSSLRTMILVWAMTWTMMVPLFHVHPEADHRHGNDNHTHGGTVHTVFSPDLECEYVEYIRDLTCSEAPSHHLQARAHTGHGFNHPEIEFSMLGSPKDQPSGKLWITVSGLTGAESPSVQQTVSSTSIQSVVSPTVLFLSTALPLRAPPSQYL